MSRISKILVAAGAALLTAMSGASAVQSAELPMPCVSGVCGANIPGFVTSGRATAVNTGSVLRVRQQTDRAILNWASFNVGADGKVIFEQPNAGSIALNRIFQGSPSRILGAIEANGQIFLVNQNGFMFGPTARVRTSGLLVSSLDMTNQTFENGLLSPLKDNRAALESDGRVGVLDPSGQPVRGDDGEPLKVQISIAAGAKISTLGTGGRVMIASKTIDNAGSIETPDGQVVLAAGEKVYLQASSDPALRGLLVEVDAGGEAWNRMTGNVSAARGNVTMVGLAVNQQGRVSATSTVSANGSVRLLARDSVKIEFDGAQNPLLTTTRGGQLELGASSQTTVLPELDDPTTAIDEQKQLPSSIELQGRQVFVRGGARVQAPGGSIRLRALNNEQDVLGRDAEARVRVEAGAVIDASGSDATASVSRNVVRVELRGNELRDAPLQRDGALRGKEVFVDARVGTPLADVSGAIAGIGRAIDERTSAGGTISVESFGDIAVAPGATFDVSGGTMHYTGGAVQTTQLLTADGRAVDIGQAKPDQLYVGLINPSSRRSFDRWGVTEQVQGPLIGRYEPGYTEGRSAGTLQFFGRAMALDGNFLGNVTIGANQRDAARAPLGGRFIVGSDLIAGATIPDYRAPSINLVAQPTPTSVGDEASLPQRPLDLATTFATAGGFTRLELYSNGVVHLPESMMLALAPGSSLRITAHRVELDGSVAAAGGSVRLASVVTTGVDNSVLPRAGVVLGDNATLDVRGLWNNELSLLTPIYRDGGEIDLAVRAIDGELTLGDATALLVDGGASLSASGIVTGGKGGRIGLHVAPVGGAFDVGHDVAISAFGVAGARGGAFTLEAPRLQFVAGSGWTVPQRLDLAAGDTGFLTFNDSLFSAFGFASFDFTATGAREEGETDTLVVRSGANLDARAHTLLLDDASGAHSSGGPVGGFAHAALAPDYSRSSTSVSLRVDPRGFSVADDVGRLSIEQNATVHVDARGSVNLTSVGGISVAGEIVAPGGTVSAFIPNPSEIFDAGYRAELGISFLGSARVDVAGISLLKPSDAGLLQGEVLAGGAVNLLVDRGFVRAASGADFDLRGTSSSIDIPGAGSAGGFLRRSIASSGGALTLRSPESIDFAAVLHAQAGSGDTVAAAGSATFQLTRQRGFQEVRPEFGYTYPTNPRTLLVVSDRSALAAGQNGIGIVDAGWVRASGIDALSLEAGNRIELYSGADLSLGRSLQLFAPLIGVSGDGVNLSASYISIGTRVDTSALTPALALPGAGHLAVHGDLVELTGTTTLTGIASATFEASRELRLRGFESAGTSVGALRVAADLTLRAPVIYPTTETKFSIVAAGGANDRVTFESTLASDAVPFSVGGELDVSARSIAQRGRLIAPFGRITLAASDDLTLADGSVTSVSAAGTLLPFGRVQLGSDWVYQLGSTVIAAPKLAAPAVDLNARDLSIAKDATVDLAGGGDLYAYEWMPGTGGSRDALAPGATPGLYAILPQLRDGFAPYDPQEFAGSDLKPGDSIYLSGVAGLPAGVYPLLPARYALLPGAMLVSQVAGTTDAVPGVRTQLADGTPVVAGYRTFAGTGLRDAHVSGFVVWPGSYARSLATYQDSRASTFDAAHRPVAPDDAARLVLTATHAFDLAGHVLAAANAKGAGAAIDIAAPQLAIHGAGGANVAGAVNVDASILQGWKAGSLLLGGRRADDGRTIEVVSDGLTFGSGTQLSGTEIVAVARDELRLENGSAISSSGTVLAPTFAQEAPLALAGDSSGAAVLGVSGLRALNVSRGPATTGGAIVAAAGSRIASTGSLLIDGPQSIDALGTIDGAGATWALGSSDIYFGGQPQGSGLTIGAGLLANLGSAARLRLSAADAVTFAESVQLGTLNEMVFDTPTLRSSAPGADVSFAANSLTLLNAAGAPDAAFAASNAGTLSFSARDVVIGPGSIKVDGFETLVIGAQNEIVGRGTARLAAARDISLTAANIGAASDADLGISAVGTLHTARSATPLANTVRVGSELGGHVTLSANDIDHAGALRVASGLVELNAANSLTVAGTGSLDVSGVSVTAAGRSVGSGGGALRLRSGGSLDLDAGSSLRVAGAGDADAGSIGIAGVGRANIAADFFAQAVAAARGGSFVADFGSLGDFSALNDALEAGGFTERRAIHLSQGDLTLAAGHSLVAHDVHLATDTGLLTIAGSIDASSGNQRGRVELTGGAGLSLASGARISARGTGDLGRGGSVVLASSAGEVNLSAGSALALGGANENGRLTIRAAATDDGMRLGALDAAVSGVDFIALQPVLNFDLDANPGSAEFSTIRTQVDDFMAVAAPALLAQYSTGTTPVAVRPGIDLFTEGDLTLGSLDLSSWRFGGEPAALAFRATGAISIDGTISDGFQRIGTAANARIDLIDGDSSSLSFNAGSDIYLGANARVRTGTGDLTLRAAADIVFDSGASVYTAGRPGEATHVFARGASLALPTHGGQLMLDAGHDVLGAAVTQAVGVWQVRQSREVTTPPQGPTSPGWGTDIQQFGWNLGTLGGGDITVRAGNDIRDLSAAAADSATVKAGALSRYGGGVLEFDAQRDITSAFVHLTRGDNVLHAGGEIGRSLPSDTGELLGSLFSMQEGSLSLFARRGIAIETAFNPTLLAQSIQGNSFRSYFMSYGADSALRARSATGAVVLNGTRERLIPFLGDDVVGGNDAEFLALLPPSVALRATDGDVHFDGPTTTLAPSDNGQLDIFASRDIVGAGGPSLVMSDAPAAELPTVFAPGAVALLGTQVARAAASGRHLDDSLPVSINAGRDIVALRVELPKFARVAAGRDLRNVNFIGQNVRTTDTTILNAGRDLVYDTSAGNSQIQVGGPGRLDLIAARDVDLGFSSGIATVGRLVNPALTTEQGADITVLAGSGAPLDVVQFIAKIIAPTTIYRTALESFVAQTAGAPASGFDAAVTSFKGLGAELQRAFLLPVFFAELVASGRDANNIPGAGFERGYAAIDALFPGSRNPATPPQYDGDIKLAFSRIYTLADADISLLAPGGLLNVGLANPPPSLAGTRKPSELGIVAQRAGSVRIFTNDDVLVNQSRVFTLRGGDIAIWSTVGDIDAGRGAKSAISAPPPTILVDPSGRVTLDFAGAVAGSGIRAIVTADDIKPGDVDLIAPAGKVDSGDAGIGSAGNLNVAAQQVVGLDNFNAGGTATGVPSETSSLGASLSGASAVGSSATSAASDAAGVGGAQQATAPLADSAFGFLDVFLEGFGGEVCKPDDTECLKRNQK